MHTPPGFRFSSTVLVLGLLLGGVFPSRGQHMHKQSSPPRQTAAAYVNSPEDFPGQTRAQVQAPAPERRVALARAPRSSIASSHSPEVQQLKHLKQKVELGVPLTGQDLLFLALWKREHSLTASTNNGSDVRNP